MMPHLDWFKAGGATRGTPVRISSPVVRLMALAFIGSTAFLNMGCQSAPTSSSCNSCGSCGKCNICGLFSRATNRIFHRNRVYSDSLPVSDGVVEYGGAGVVVPGTIPSYSSGSSGGTSSSSVSPSTSTNPTDLEPAPTAKPGAASGSSGSSSSGVRKSSYTARRSSTSTAMQTTRSITSTPASTTRPTSLPLQENANMSGATSDGSLEDNILDHLPPLGLPKEVTTTSASPPAPPAPPANKKTGETVSVVPTAQRGGAPTEPDFALTIAAETASEPVSTVGVAVGIHYFSAVDLNLAGGSGPAEAGLSWLAEKGYRTVLDLRETSEVPSSFISEVARRGIRYVALPTNLNSLNKEALERFNFEINSGEARPLFFFDSDGSRAGALWYLRRVTMDHVSLEIARKEAEDIGLVDKAALSATNDRLEKIQAPKINHNAGQSNEGRPLNLPPINAGRQLEPEQGQGAGIAEQHKTTEVPLTFQDFLNEVNPDKGKEYTKDKLPKPEQDAREPKKASNQDVPVTSNDFLVWRPLAAMLLTGLGIPLTYWTRTAIPEYLAKARASLPAPGRQPRSLPHGSDA